ncbi:MAG: hypothetical protein IIB53_13910 [Planctomycetes bacterium]|nr:hypothetical protein [Planctomycetota bacterium]MCH8260960.1 hypothetical protein [Planctomycetota bacterium]
MRVRKMSLTTLAMASILPWIATSVSSADKAEVLLDPPPLPSGGSGVEVVPGKPRWVALDDFVPGEAPPLRRSDPGLPIAPPLTMPTLTPDVAFDGIIDVGGLVPPDTHLAVGPGLAAAGRVIMVTNQQVGLWDKTGGLIAQRGLSNMFTGVGPFAFDPKILFDQHSGRFFIVCLRGFNTTQSEIHIAISSSGTPNNLSTDWTFLVGSGLTNVGGFDTWSDYPGIGADALSLFTTVNLFDGSSAFRGIKIRIFDKAALLGGSYTFVDKNYADSSTNVSTTQPAHVFGTTANGGFYLISRLGSTTYRLFHITGHPAAPVATTNTFVWSGGTFPSDGGADQCTVANPDVATLRSRIQNAIHRNGHIWCTLAADPDNDGRVEVVWQDIRDNGYPTNAPTVFQSGFINGTGANPWTYMPSINVNATGDAAIVYTQSSTVECPNMYYVSRLSIDALGTFQAPVLARTSAGFYDSFASSNPDRWGDYSAVAIDPTDDCFWMAQEFVFTSGVGNSRWGTHIARFCPEPYGACCFDDRSCTVEVQDDCDSLGGTYQGDGTDCTANPCPLPCPADFDISGDVGVKDLLFLLGAWGPCPKKGDCSADFDRSGDVGVKDLLFLLGAWGPCP